MIAGSNVLLAHVETMFTCSPEGRIVRQNDPPRSRGPQLWIAGSATGNVWRLGSQVSQGAARAMDEKLHGEPPLSGARAKPIHLEEYVAILERAGTSGQVAHGVHYWVADALAAPSGGFVTSGTARGDELFARVTAHMPEELAAMGYTTLWEPWVAAIDGAEIAAVAETVRRSPAGAEIGVSTVRSRRRRGFALAATIAWCRHPELAAGPRFYSTAQDNIASQGVARRAGLAFLGATCSID